MRSGKQVRVRFAPSPTGHLHIGGARTALFNWLFARRTRGAFILRIEDTDRARSTREAMSAIIDGLEWLGLDWDEGPHYQSRRGERYLEVAESLLSRGAAYRAEGKLGARQAVIFRVPREKILLDDLVYGAIEFDGGLLEDLVLMKSDGTPAYNFACAVDDADMEISHVIRGEDHISNTPKQLLLYRAMGTDPPKFAHVPLILGPDKSRLSKRHGATSLAEYRRAGMLPAAMINYLVLLGWSSGDDREIFSKKELIDRFSLEGISRKSAIFDPDKLKWMNGCYIRDSTPEELLNSALPFLEEAGLGGDGGKRRLLLDALGLMREKVRTLRDIPEAIRFFLNDTLSYDEEAVSKHLSKSRNIDILELLSQRLRKVHTWDIASIEACVRGLASERGVKAAAIIHPARAAVTGRIAGPGLFELMGVLGQETTAGRLDEAVKRFREGAQ